MTTAKMKIGGQDYDLPELNFKNLKKAWPLVRNVQGSEDPMELADSAADVIVLSLTQADKTHDKDWLEENLTASESQNLSDALLSLMASSGLIAAKGGPKPSGEEVGAAPSTETSTGSSPNSSQPVAPPETGTE